MPPRRPIPVRLSSRALVALSLDDGAMRRAYVADRGDEATLVVEIRDRRSCLRGDAVTLWRIAADLEERADPSPFGFMEPREVRRACAGAAARLRAALAAAGVTRPADCA